MNTKQYLSQIAVLNTKISNKLFEKFELKSMIGSISNTVKEVNVQSGHTSDHTVDTICKLIDLEHEIDALVDEFVDTKAHIIQQMEQLDFKEYNLLFKRYVKQLSFEEIAKETGYTKRHVCRMHTDALDIFEDNFGKEYIDK